MIIAAPRAAAFSADTYASESALASGRWVKISVAESGIHFISASQLRQWGFSDPTRVTIHGYGAIRVPEQMTLATFRDDLAEVPVHRSSTGIYFYGVGPVDWIPYNSSGYYMQQLNPFTSRGYYFVTDSRPGTPAAVEQVSSSAAPGSAADFFLCRLYQETDQVSLGRSGSQFFGDDFRSTRQRSYKFSLKDRVAGRSAWMRIGFACNSSAASTLSATVNDKAFGSPRTMTAAGDNYGTLGTLISTFEPDADQADVRLTYATSGVVKSAHLDGITINYYRHLRLDGGKLQFNLTQTTAALDGASASTHVWDITEPARPIAMTTAMTDGRLRWTNPYTGRREYIAWNEGTTYPSPSLVGSVANQNIHGEESTPDMIIITVNDFRGEAERIAALHRRAPDNFNVLVVSQDEVFNEFSSGSRDIGAFRRMLKMFYDRGTRAGHPLRYCLLLGHPTFDVRAVTSEMRNYSGPYMPSWQSAESLSEAGTYTTDDILTLLDDNSGASPQYDRQCIAIGRIPARNLTQAKTYVDKLYAYADNRLLSEWKNTVVLEADNGNEGVFAVGYEPSGSRRTGIDGMHRDLAADPDASQFIYHKIYYDAYPLQNGSCPQADNLFDRYLKEGILFWVYNGHGSISGLSGEGVHNLSKINNMSNKHWPVLLALTCSFGDWDTSDISGIETLCATSDGGTIAAISSSRKAQISDNDVIVDALGRTLLRRDADGQYMRIGDMMLKAKNSLRTSNVSSAATTKLRYVTLGDPAMRLGAPSNRIELSSVAGTSPSQNPEIMARQNVLIEGELYDADGQPLDDFNGTLHLTLYDAERSATTLGLYANGTPGHSFIYDEKGEKLLSQRAGVTGGRFSTVINMPSEIADNYRPATLNLYASSTDGREAMGVSTDIYVCGYDDSAEADSIAPIINYAYLNHASFTNGSTVNEQPMFIAGVSDDVAINLSMAGIGHQMSLKLDDSRSFTDLSLYYTPAADGSPSGTIAYPISELPEGNHTLNFRVWDTSGNSASRDIAFFVERGAMPQMFEIYSDANPATTQANFYLTHNRPDAMATVKLDIYSIGGRHIWSSTVTGRSDMFLSTPIAWDLCDMGGQRVQRGIYIYRATLTIDGHDLVSPAKRIAVTGH